MLCHSFCPEEPSLVRNVVALLRSKHGIMRGGGGKVRVFASGAHVVALPALPPLRPHLPGWGPGVPCRRA